MSNGSEKPQEPASVEAVSGGMAEVDDDPFGAMLARSIQRAFEPIIEKGRKKREARELALGAKIDESLAQPENDS